MALLCVLGPTAVGKTELSLRIAARIGGEIVSVDSRQIYCYMNIGTAKPTPEQLTAMLEHIENPDEFMTWFPFPSVASDDEEFAHVGWRGPGWASQVLWFAMGLRHAGRVELAGRIVKCALDAMAKVLSVDGAIHECYNPHAPDMSDFRLFDYAGEGDPVRRYYVGHAPVRAMVLSGLLGIEPTRDGLLIAPAEESINGDVSVEFLIGKYLYVLELKRRKEGLETIVRRGRKVVASSYGRTLVPRVELL